MKNLDPVEKHLLALETSMDWRRRLRAAVALGAEDSPAVVTALQKFLARDTNEHVRRALCASLGRAGIADRSAELLLTKAFHDDDFGVRLEAARALRQAQAEAVGGLTPRPLFSLNGADRRKIRWAIFRTMPRGRQGLMRYFKTKYPEIRAKALLILTDLEERRLVLPAATALLKDRDPRVRSAAAQCLGHFRDRRSIRALRPLADDPSARVRKWAVFAMQRQGMTAATEPLKRLLKDRSPEVRAQCVLSLAQATPEELAMKEIAAALKDPAQDVRAAAGYALASAGRSRWVPKRMLLRLMRTSQDRDKDVRLMYA
ncbi:MAG: HEAT repeat domain-containing protein, partial [Candidatus Eisenbacteria bacterium]